MRCLWYDWRNCFLHRDHFLCFLLKWVFFFSWLFNCWLLYYGFLNWDLFHWNLSYWWLFLILFPNLFCLLYFFDRLSFRFLLYFSLDFPFLSLFLFLFLSLFSFNHTAFAGNTQFIIINRTGINRIYIHIPRQINPHQPIPILPDKIFKPLDNFNFMDW